MQRFQSNSREETFTPQLKKSGFTWGMLTSRKSINSYIALDAVSQELYMHNTFTPEVLTRREIFVNNIVSNSLAERVLTLMGGGLDVAYLSAI